MYFNAPTQEEAKRAVRADSPVHAAAVQGAAPGLIYAALTDADADGAAVRGPVTVPAQAAMATGMGMTSKGEFFSGAGMRSPISPDLSSAGMTTYSAQDPFADGEAPRLGVPVSPPPRVLTPGTPPNALRSLSPPPRSLTPGSSGPPSAYVASRARCDKKAGNRVHREPVLSGGSGGAHSCADR